VDSIRSLLEKGADPNGYGEILLGSPENVDNRLLKDSDDIPLLHTAVLFGKLENSQLLLEIGADPNRLHPVNGETAWQAAIRFRNWEMARLLLEKGADLNIHGENVFCPVERCA
jgi:ankyrin repeat protein